MNHTEKLFLASYYFEKSAGRATGLLDAARKIFGGGGAKPDPEFITDKKILGNAAQNAAKQNQTAVQKNPISNKKEELGDGVTPEIDNISPYEGPPNKNVKSTGEQPRGENAASTADEAQNVAGKVVDENGSFMDEQGNVAFQDGTKIMPDGRTVRPDGRIEWPDGSVTRPMPRTLREYVAQNPKKTIFGGVPTLAVAGGAANQYPTSVGDHVRNAEEAEAAREFLGNNKLTGIWNALFNRNDDETVRLNNMAGIFNSLGESAEEMYNYASQSLGNEDIQKLLMMGGTGILGAMVLKRVLSDRGQQPQQVTAAPRRGRRAYQRPTNDFEMSEQELANAAKARLMRDLYA